jgi:hypothetical protein
MAPRPGDIGQVRRGGSSAPGRLPGAGQRQTSIGARPNVPQAKYKAMGGLLAQVSRGANVLADAQAQKQAREVQREAERAAARDVLAAEDVADIAMPMGTSIAEEAYRRTAQSVAQIRLEKSAFETVDRLAEEHSADPVAFRATAEAAMRGQLREIDPEMRPQVLDTWNRALRSRADRIDRRRRELDTDAFRAEFVDAHETLSVEAARAAYDGDLDDAFATVDRMADLYAAGGPREDGGAGTFTRAEIATMQNESLQNVRENFVVGWAERADNPRDALAAIKAGETGVAEIDSVLENMTPEELSGARRLIERRISEQEAEFRAYEREVGREVSAAVDLLNEGVMPAGLNETAARAQGTAHAEELGLAAETYTALGEFPVMPLDEKQAQLAEVRAELRSLSADGPAAMQRQEELIRRRDMMVKQIEADQAAADNGTVIERYAETVQPPPPIDFTQRSWAVRASYVDAAASHFGAGGASLLTDDEADQFMTALDQAPADQRLAMIGEASTALDDAASRLWRQVAGKRPDYAHVGLLATMGADRKTLRDATLGADILAAGDKTIAMPTQADRQLAVQKVVGEAVHEGTPPEFMTGVTATADGIYAARMRAEGDTGTFDRALYREALHEALGRRRGGTGGVGSVNGRMTLLPSGWRDGEVDRVLSDMGQETWAAASALGGRPVYGTGEPVDIDELQGAELIATAPGSGRYIVRTAAGVVVDARDPDGRPYVLDINRARDAVQRRRAAEPAPNPVRERRERR